jgi:hypothetical protein
MHTEHAGCRYYRYPESSRAHHRNYWYDPVRKRFLHRVIWESVHGPIPSGSHIHHLNGDPLDNRIENLGCIDDGEHMRHHHAGCCSERKRANLAAILPLTKAWHASPAGKAWHRKHGAYAASCKERIERQCEQCGKTYVAVNTGNNRFCHANCKARALRARRRAAR